jgi:Concanavalin A-like lectin/glucanases superfamily/Pentaxin family
MKTLNNTCMTLALILMMASAASGATLKFDGVDGQVVVGAQAPLKMTNAMTLEAWIQPTRPVTTADTRDVIMGREGEYLLARGGDGVIYYAKATPTGSFTWRTTGHVVPSQQWAHLALTFDGTLVKLYDHGIEVFSETAAGNVGDANASQNEFRIGGRQAAAQLFQGQIDEVRVWNVARSAAEITASLNRPLTGNESGLAAYYPMNEGSGSVTLDATGQGLTGTRFNGVFWNPVEDALGAPLVLTGPALSPDGLTATLQARVDHRGVDTTNHFEWGAGSDALAFDGVDDYVQVDNGPDLANRSFSVEFWARRQRADAAEFLFNMGTATTDKLLHLGWRSATVMTFAFYADDLNITVDGDDLGWHHWAFTYDSATRLKRVYQDGVLAGEGLANANFSGAGPLRLGAYFAGSTINYLAGAMDEVRVWKDVVLDVDTIRQWMAKEVGSAHPNFASLEAYWNFEEGTGSTAQDATGHGFDGRFVSSPVRESGGRPVFDQSTAPARVAGVNNALNLDGLDDYVDVPSGTWFSDVPFTIEAWVYVRHPNRYARIIDFGNGPGSDNVVFSLSSGTSGQFYLAIVRGGVGQTVTSPEPVPLNQWVHLAASWSGGKATLFQNGVPVASANVQAPLAVSRQDNFIGRSNFPTDDYADALFDDVRIWNAALPGQTIRQWMNQPNLATHPNGASLAAQWNFDETSGTVALDSLRRRNGTLVNGAQRFASVPVEETLSNLVPGTTYHVRAVAENSNGATTGRSVRFVTPAPGRGAALAFDGIDDYVRIADLDADTPLSEVTVEFWQRVNSVRRQSVFSLEPDLTANRMQAHTPWANEVVYWDFGNINAGGRLTYIPPTSPVGDWNHFALVASASGNYMRIYRNGVLEAQKSGMDPREMGSFDLILGRYTLDGISYYLNGVLDEFRVWNVARTEDQIRQFMNQPLADGEPGLVVYNRMDEGAGPTLRDSSSFQRDGVLFHGTSWVPSTAPVGLPIPLTLPASDVNAGLARVSGTVNGDGVEPSRVWFEYGTDTSYGSRTTVMTLPVDADVESVSELLSGLMANTVYHYRLAAANDHGTNYGADFTFTMLHPVAQTALRFDGSDDYLIANPFPNFPRTNITVEFWMKADLPPKSFATLVSYAVSGSDNEFFVDVRNSMQNFTVGVDAVSSGLINAPVDDGQWHHIAASWRNSDGLFNFYKDGIKIFTTNNLATGHAMTLNGSLVLGQDQDSVGGGFDPNQAFPGQMDDFRIWNTFRSDEEIAESWRRTLAGDEKDLEVNYLFDEGAGTMVEDRTGHGHGGSLRNGATYTASGAGLFEPRVVTQLATPVLATTATLRGTVNPAGFGTNTEDTVAYFEYGPSIAFGRITERMSVGNGIATIPYVAGISNLEPGTTYYFRLVAYNQAGTNYGARLSFNTLVLGCGWPIASKVTGGAASFPRHAIDNDGNTYVAGLFSGAATFNTTLLPLGGSPTNAFVGKLSRGADWLWVNQISVSDPGSIAIQGVALDASNNVYVAGAFSGTATFGAQPLTAGPAGDLFVAKLESAGTNWLWAKSAGAAGSDQALALAVLPGGTVYVAGQYRGAVAFGAQNLSSVGGSDDIFVAKLDTGGNWLWARSAGGVGTNETARALAVYGENDVYVAGQFSGSASFDSFNLEAKGGGSDLFVARLNAEGTWLLARRAGGDAGNDTATGLAVDSAGQLYLLGRFDGTADYNDTVENLNANGGERVFVAKLNKEANMLWYAQAGRGEADGIAADNAGRVYVAGEFTISTGFGPGNPQPLALVSSGNSDVFVARLDAESGLWDWAQKIGSSGSESHGSITVDSEGGVVVSGSFQNTVQIGFVLLTSANARDIFVARLDAGGVYEHNNFDIGEAITVPALALDPGREDGGAIGQPLITILEREYPDSDALNSFVWSVAKHQLYAVRPVTAVIKWPLTQDVTNTTSVATCVARTLWPADPQIHVANAPVELEPRPDFPFKIQSIAFTTINGAAFDAGFKVFNAPQPGWTVLHFLETGGTPGDITVHPSVFEVVRTVAWNDPARLRDNQPAVIGEALPRGSHDDPTGKNGFVYFERAYYDGSGDERAYNRATRTGPIIPVNQIPLNQDTTTPDHDLVVVWYHRSPATGVAWPDQPVRYIAAWPATPAELPLASDLGSGVLDPLQFPNKRVYNQPDLALPGFNPNEEHAMIVGDTLYALRNDLNAVVGASEPFTLLKYRNPGDGQWTMRVYKIVTTNATARLAYGGQAGRELRLPGALGLLPLCGSSNRFVSGPGFKDRDGRLYARAAGPDNTGAAIVARYWYPLQPGFFYDLDLDGQPDAPVGSCLPWLDRRSGGALGVPVDVAYSITWPTDSPQLRVGETLFGAKNGLPDVRNFARAEIIFDQGNPYDTNALSSLVRLFDPLSDRILQVRPTGDTNVIRRSGYGVFRSDEPELLFAGLATANQLGKLVFTDLPYVLRSRLIYDPLNHNLAFRGLLDESSRYGGPDNPLLLVNVLSPRERERIKQLNPGNTDFAALIDALYNLTRNPGRLDVDRDGQPDATLLVGLTCAECTTNNATGAVSGRLVHEALDDVPKVLTAGLAHGTGYLTVVENNATALSGLPVQLHVLKVDGGPFLGDIKVLEPDNVFDEKLTLRHSSDFGAEPQNFEFEWYYKPDDGNLDPTDLPTVDANGAIQDPRGWTPYPGLPPGGQGFNDITVGDNDTGAASRLLTLSDNGFVCRYRGYIIDGQTNWSDWVGVIGGGRAQLAPGWVKRVVFGLNPFETRTKEFHKSETVTFASMLQQAGPRYEGDIAFNPDASNLNNIGLIEAYETVLRRAKKLSIEGAPPLDYPPANNALLLAAGRIADFYMLLGNEAFADAADPTIGFRTDGAGYGTLAPSIFTFQNQLDSLLEEEVVLLRGRDDRSASVRVPPVYNRLFWNFTHDEGEVAYAQAYNITDQNQDGVINADDARIMYPQGHGDAWGHYLTATKAYYDLLRNPYFEWVPRTESILLAGNPVTVDYLDERKFARAAAAKAKTGAEIVDLTYRINYVDDPAGQYQGYKDTDPDRAWGVSDWAHRAGSAAFYDWVTANAILPAEDPNPNHAGIEKIDRTTVLEIDEIAAAFDGVQSRMDRADAGLNPLGLAKGVVPFDIDPTEISAGQTHFEQIYQRALSAVNNTVTIFDHANQLSQSLRALQDNVNDFARRADQQERDYKNRLIEIFGYPYKGDIGPGLTYPSGYDGPDIYHYMYVNTVELNGDTAPPSRTFTGFFTKKLGLNIDKPSAFKPEIDFEQRKLDFGGGEFYFPGDAPEDTGDRLNEDVLEISFPYTAGDYGFAAPQSWGQRRAPGEIQLALSELVQDQARFKQALLNYDNLIQQIEDTRELIQVRYDVEADRVEIRNAADKTKVTLAGAILAAKGTAKLLHLASAKVEKIGDAGEEAVPKVVGLATDGFSWLRSALKLAKAGVTLALDGGAVVAERAAEVSEEAKKELPFETGFELQSAGFPYEVQQQFNVLDQLIRQEVVLRVEAFAQREVLNQAAGRYQAAVAKGLRLLDERVAFRRNAAADTQASRYQDMTFRIFRNDAIQKYRAQFDLAAQYVFLAAVAYDYETQLLGGHTGAGREFLTDIIRQRALGQIENGVPVAGRHGLADPLARLSQNFAVLKGQLGFNNPQTETGRFSLRKELFRQGNNSGEAWRDQLRKNIVPNLWDVPEFRRYCRPFAPESAGPQPGLVIRFPTTVTFGLNYFGWPLGGGDNAYDSTLFATKVRSAGVWFSDYNGTGLSLTPRVYLVPVGADVLRSPTDFTLETREWRVVDQKIPVPFPIGFSTLNDDTWIPMNDSLSDQYAAIRRFSSFRAYHDSGSFNPDETISDSRLIGRSVWNTDWMLIIPGGTFLFDPNQGLEAFVNSVSDIKIFFQTYAVSGN